MLYFKNIEVAKKYHISLGTVRNWIDAAQKGKIGLVLYNDANKTYIANTVSNVTIMDELVISRKKYRPGHAVQVLVPQPAFYELYNMTQIYDIVTNLEVRHEVPRRYSYFDGGASAWDEYIKRMDKEDKPSNLTRTRELLKQNEGYIDSLLVQYDKVNVVDVGVGNAYPVKDLLAHLLSTGKLGRYIAIDISPQMLGLARHNIEAWFEDKVVAEYHELDISRDRFASLLVDDYIRDVSNDTGNLILFLGGTLQNFKKRDIPLQVINESMGINDLLVYTQKLDTANTRNQFDFGSQPGTQGIPSTQRTVIDLLNIEPSYYDLETGYDQQRCERYARIRLRTSLVIRFDFTDGERIINFDRGQTILIWRASQDNAFDVFGLFDRNDFYMLQSSQSIDQEYILTISRVKSN